MEKTQKYEKRGRVDDRKRVSLAGIPAQGEYRIILDPETGIITMTPVVMVDEHRYEFLKALAGSGTRPR